MTLHSLTPHQHEKAQENDMEGRGVLGFLIEQLGDVFGQDLGEGHLEDYVSAQKGLDTLNDELLSFSLVPSIFDYETSELKAFSSQSEPFFIAAADPLVSQRVYADLPSRAPPTAV